MSKNLEDILVEEVQKVVRPEWLSYSDEDWKTVAQVFDLHFRLENIINLLLTIYFLGSTAREKSDTFREVILEEVDFLRKLRMLQKLGWIDGKSSNVATELNNFRRDFAHPKRGTVSKRLDEFRKKGLSKKYNDLVTKMIKLVVLRDKDYRKKLITILKQERKGKKGGE